jgi:hypothetical protein
MQFSLPGLRRDGVHPIDEADRSMITAADAASRIQVFFAQLGARDDGIDRAPAEILGLMIDAGLDRLSRPGGGRTLARWRALAAVAAQDLSLLKLYEGHTDALAILAEAAGGAAPAAGAWGVWCAEPPDARISIAALGPGAVSVSGVKAWCSGASVLSHALVSGWNAQGEPCLAAVALDQPGVALTAQGWHAVGMAATASVNVMFDAAEGRQIGRPGFYTGRPGFWHGGAGIAACWYGAAARLAELMRQKLRCRSDPHALAHLGAVDAALAAAADSLRAAAQAIDDFPDADACHLALRVRSIAEKAAGEVITAAGRALGAAAFCRDRDSSRILADLPVFLRQSHAERDLAALGAGLLEAEASPWIL